MIPTPDEHTAPLLHHACNTWVRDRPAGIDSGLEWILGGSSRRALDVFGSTNIDEPRRPTLAYAVLTGCVMRTFSAILFCAALAGCSFDPSGPDDFDETESDLVSDPKAALKAAKFRLGGADVQPAKATFVSHPDYLAANVPLQPIAALRTAVESTLAGKLKNRGEAHVTTLTPAEFGILKRKLSGSEIDAMALRAGVQTAKLSVKCVGMGEKGKDRTFYVVVDSTDLVAVRKALATAYVAKGGRPSDFDAANFFPHVTLGFTKRDLFESDGVTKSVASCPNPKGIEVLP